LDRAEAKYSNIDSNPGYLRNLNMAILNIIDLGLLCEEMKYTVNVQPYF